MLTHSNRIQSWDESTLHQAKLTLLVDKLVFGIFSITD